ncbi:MAG: T9SS type A sorting domain-containing protein [Bacteroidetes bacterium]|nr:T9SS type A sorting domain-containing protein [Bacteroidota bacterium]
MKTITRITLLNVCLTLNILFPGNIFCQQIPSADAYTAEDTVCIWDNTVSFTTTKKYTAYQTTDNTFNGPIDSNYCVSLRYEEAFSGLSFWPADFDLSRSIYIKAQINDNEQIPLEKDAVYMLEEDFLNSTDGLIFGNDCPELICSGLIIGITIPDSTLTSDTTRWHVISGDSYDYNTCFATEKFEDQKLNSLIYKFTINPDLVEVAKDYSPPYINQLGDVQLITDLTNVDGNYVGGEYNVYDYYFLSYPIGVLKYDNLTYPSTNYFDYIDVSPNPNTTEVQIINLTINEGYTLLTQPYVQLRGAQVEGDTLRHEVNLINNGGTFCVSVAEMIFDGNTHYIFKKGAMDLYSPMSCLMFRNGASIEVADDGHLAYGKNGTGVLGLGSGGTIKIGKNASLTINNRVSIIKNPNSVYSGDIYMNLNKGSKLTFGQGASITNDEKSLSGGHLCIYMNGGELDMSGLDDFSRHLIRLIYPEQEKTMSANMHVYPNPVQNSFTVEIVSVEATTGEINITGLNGAVIYTKKYELEAGINAIKIQIQDLKPGAYTIQCKTNAENGSTTFVKL